MLSTEKLYKAGTRILIFSTGQIMGSIFTIRNSKLRQIINFLYDSMQNYVSCPEYKKTSILKELQSFVSNKLGANKSFFE